MTAMHPRAVALVERLRLERHPEGGWYREVFRSPQRVTPHDARATRSALTTIDFLLNAGEFSAWHRVRSDEAWHLLEGGPLRLWLMAPELDALHSIELAQAGTVRHVVPGQWWQAAEPLGDFAYVGATVGPGFEFADFGFMREDVAALAALDRLAPAAARLL